MKVKYLHPDETGKSIEKKGTLINFAAYPVVSTANVRVPAILGLVKVKMSFGQRLAALFGLEVEHKIQSGVDLPAVIQTKEIAHVAYVLNDKTKSIDTVAASLVQII